MSTQDGGAQAGSLDYGEQVRQARREMRLTQKQLAARLGIGNVHLSEIERGTRTPGHDLADRIEYETGVRRETPRERRLREERDALAAQVAALTAERERLRQGLTTIARGIWTARNSVESMVDMARYALVDADKIATTPPAGAQERCPETGELVEDCMCYLHADARTLAIRRGDIGPDEDWPPEDWPAGSGER